jgi:hypothetical protein
MQDHKQYTMQYYGFTTDDQYDRFIELSKGPTSNFPQELVQNFKDVCARIGFCGEVMFDCIAKYVKYGNGLTGRDLYGPAMNVKTKAEAQEQLNRVIEYLQYRNPSWDSEKVEVTAKENIGYYAGYYDKETWERVYRLYNTTHPIFGSDF